MVGFTWHGDDSSRRKASESAFTGLQGELPAQENGGVMEDRGENMWSCLVDGVATCYNPIPFRALINQNFQPL
jgi:hypothetical protein